MQIFSNNKTVKLLLFACYAILSSGVIFLAYRHWAYDDPFITFRYAKNIAQGIGFVYNPGERILSTTTPLFTLILAALYPIWSDLPTAAVLVGAISLSLCGFVLWLLAQTWETPLAGWAGLLLLPTFPLLLSTLGSEMPLYLLFCLSAITAFAKSRNNLAAVFSALAFLTRPDGILIPIILLIYYLWQKPHQIPWKPIVIFLVLTLPWIIFAWFYFGTPIPATLAAKQHQGLMSISQHFLPGSIAIFRPYLKQSFFQIEVILALFGVWFTVKYARSWMLLFIWLLTYSLAYSILGVPRYFWYYAPLIPGLLALTGLGIEFLGSLKNNSPLLSLPIRALPYAVILLLAVVQSYTLTTNWGKIDKRYPIYSEIGIWLQDNTPIKAKVATLEVGIIGYFSDRTMIDFAGLIQPETSKQFSKEHAYQNSALWSLQTYSPDYVVLHQGVFPEIKGTYIQNNCELVKTFPKLQYNFQHTMLIFHCSPHN